MRQASIPKTVVDALNELFDTNPDAVTALMKVRSEIYQTTPDEEGNVPQVDVAGSLGVLDFVNVILDSLAPGKRVATIYGPDGFDGFVLGRDRKPQPPQ